MNPYPIQLEISGPTAQYATENHIIPAFLEMVLNQSQNSRNRSLN